MRSFILGVIVTLAILMLGGIAFLLLGLMPTSADATPPALEMSIATHALDASMDRKAPRLNNPVTPTDDNVIEGMKIYTMNCAVCHGTLDLKPSVLQGSFYPPPPQIVLHPLDDPEWKMFYAIRTGVRYTGMPAWKKALSEHDMWKVTGFLSRIEKLTPAVQDYWKKAYGVSPQPGASDEGKHD
jgi:mono/diheme cytochrome c family protein